MRIGMNRFPSMEGSGILATRLGEHLADRGHIVNLMVCAGQSFKEGRIRLFIEEMAHLSKHN